MIRRTRVRRFMVYREFGAISCYDVHYARQSYWESFRVCYDALVTGGDLRGDYKVTITLGGETMIVENDGDWAIAFLKWPNV
jgi:hypothetical protein